MTQRFACDNTITSFAWVLGDFHGFGRCRTDNEHGRTDDRVGIFFKAESTMHAPTYIAPTLERNSRAFYTMPYDTTDTKYMYLLQYSYMIDKPVCDRFHCECARPSQ